jgi:hypothetical protein
LASRPHRSGRHSAGGCSPLEVSSPRSLA